MPLGEIFMRRGGYFMKKKNYCIDNIFAVIDFNIIK